MVGMCWQSRMLRASAQLPQYRSNSNTQMLSASAPCIPLPASWLSPMLLNRHEEHTHAPLRVPAGFSASAL